MDDLTEILKRYWQKYFSSKKANVNLIINYLDGDKLSVHIAIQKLKGNWDIGNTSFLINHNKFNLINPILIYENKKYSRGNYLPIEMKSILQNKCIAFQMRCIGKGEQASEDYETICGVEFDIVGEPFNIAWRLKDTALVTTNFDTIETNYLITYN
jgi:hypothetical protein